MIFNTTQAIKILPNNLVYCSDGQIRRVVCSRRVRAGDLLEVSGEFIYGHEWKKPAPILEVVEEEEFQLCPEGSILLIVRTSDGTLYKKFYFCMTLEEEPTIVELSGLTDFRLINTGLDNAVDLELSAGIQPPGCSGFHYITRTVGGVEEVDFLLGNIFFSEVGGTCGNGSLDFIAERRPFLNVNPWTDNWDGLPQPNPWVFFRAGVCPLLSQRQDKHLDVSFFGDIRLENDVISLSRNEIDIHNDQTDHYDPGVLINVCVLYNKPQYERYSYDGSQLCCCDLTSILKGYYGADYPFFAVGHPGSDIGYTPFSLTFTGALCYLNVLKYEVLKILGRFVEEMHKFRVEDDGTLIYLGALDEQLHGSPDSYFRHAYWRTEAHFYVTSNDVYVSGATWPKVHQISTTIDLTFHDLSISVVGSIYWYRSGTYPQQAEWQMYPCALSLLAWHRWDSKTFLVYSDVQVEPLSNVTEEDIISGVQFYIFYYTNTVKSYLKATPLEPDEIELVDLEGNEISSSYAFKTWHTTASWQRTWGCTGREVRNVSVSVYGDIILVSYLVVAVSRSMGVLYVNAEDDFGTTGEGDLSETILERVFAFYDASKPPAERLIWRGSIDEIPVGERATVGFLMSPGA